MKFNEIEKTDIFELQLKVENSVLAGFGDIEL